ncbi:MAG: GH25 family lysozyme [Actinomycetota bacterium]
MTPPRRSRLARTVTGLAGSALAVALLAVPTAAQADVTPPPPAPAPAPAPAPFGPDVSRWQHPNGAKIDWAQVRAAGSSLAISKATEGSTYTNPYYATDVTDARANGLVVGAYHYARPALPLSTASDQATYFAAALGDVRTPATLPPILDLETTGGLTPGQLVTWAQLFTETLRTITGRVPVVYTYPSFWTVQMGGSSAFGRSPLWLATYRPTAPVPVGGWPAWTLWQYTASASVPGISGAVDMSRFAGDAAGLAAFADGTLDVPWPITAPAAPVAVRASAGVRTASVRWQPSDDGGALPTSWTVTASPGGTSVTRPGTSTTADVPGLAEGTAYSFTVTATGAAGTSPVSVPSPPVTVRGDPAGRAGTPSAAIGKGTVSLSWAAPTPAATSYAVRRCSPAPCTPVAVLASTTTPAYVDTAVIGGVTYAYAVTAANRWGSAGATASVQAMPLPTVDRLAAPTRLVARGAARTLSVAWTPVPHAARYRVLRCKGAGCVPSGTPVATVDIPAARLTQSVAPGSTFTYAVTAIAGPLASPTSPTATASALLPQALRVTSSVAVPRVGQRTTVRVVLTRADTRAPLGGRAVTVSFTPTRGPVPKPVTLTTSAAGVATTTLTPQANVVVAVRSAAPDALTLVTRTTVKVKPVVGGVLSAVAAAPTARVTLAGRTSPLFYGERVFRQVLEGGRWVIVAAAPISRVGTYELAFAAPAKPGTMVVRVLLGRTRLHEANASGALRLAVL